MDANGNDNGGYPQSRRSSLASATENGIAQHPQSRRSSFAGSVASATSAASAASVSSVVGNGHMTEEEQEERRRRIKEIMRDSQMSQQEKSRNIQSLMDGRRRSSCSTAHSSVCSNDNSYVGTMARAAAQAAEYYSDTSEHDTTMSEASYDDNDINEVASAHSEQQAPPGATYRQFHGRSLSLQDWNETDRATMAAKNNIHPAGVARLMEQSRPECSHYQRNCTLVSPCCGLAFGCRICHDDCPVLPPPLGLTLASQQKAQQNKMERRRSMPVDLEEEETHHLIDRFAVTEVICRVCYARQSSKSNKCIECSIVFGDYHCNVCNLWMSDAESPYHCTDCGFCRVGGRENFKHCDDCGMCIDATLFDDHNCKSGKYMSNCPICQEDLFSSRFASHEMPCGHAIHWHCFKELTSYDTRCPVCKKTAESPEHMAATWSAIAMGIALQPVPPDLARLVNIVCIDCEGSDTNRRWHFLGVRCLDCLSFNTNVEQIVLQGRDAAAFLDDMEAASSVGDGGGVPANISMPTVSTTAHAAIGGDGAANNDSDDMDAEDETNDQMDTRYGFL